MGNQWHTEWKLIILLGVTLLAGQYTTEMINHPTIVLCACIITYVYFVLPE